MLMPHRNTIPSQQHSSAVFDFLIKALDEDLIQESNLLLCFSFFRPVCLILSFHSLSIYAGGLFLILNRRISSRCTRMGTSSCRLCAFLQVRVNYSSSFFTACWENIRKLTRNQHLLKYLQLIKLKPLGYFFQMVISLQLGHMTTISTFMLWQKMARNTVELESAQ